MANGNTLGAFNATSNIGSNVLDALILERQLIVWAVRYDSEVKLPESRILVMRMVDNGTVRR